MSPGRREEGRSRGGGRRPLPCPLAPTPSTLPFYFQTHSSSSWLLPIEQLPTCFGFYFSVSASQCRGPPGWCGKYRWPQGSADMAFSSTQPCYVRPVSSKAVGTGSTPAASAREAALGLRKQLQGARVEAAPPRGHKGRNASQKHLPSPARCLPCPGRQQK